VILIDQLKEIDIDGVLEGRAPEGGAGAVGKWTAARRQA
jgi:hypothetical protein